MSDMSFKQAKELTERLEFAEITLARTLKKIEYASKSFDKSLSKQEKILHHIPKTDIKLTIMKVTVALNFGFVIGLVVSKYLL